MVAHSHSQSQYQMGFCCAQHLIFSIPLLLLLISTTLFNVEGRKLAQTPHNSQVEEEKTMWRAQIGSRPPRCERQCSTCTRCEAIQVPTNARINNSDEANSNYKPMSWKCKCGNLIFNP
ncbi:EPIDERMAL PATTERNING FACTOR-like protein 2 [Salvia hispanica]|uniref:EPIDERMAL PATTERNING FACTOR-like protein 2 n=1 Tax=Salvia hispanica TaxID=49212 RepID=UPI00200913D6|nr:EPIDERMAL PATTERNING FACTOR-like protein 2 [Salvia hispanica]